MQTSGASDGGAGVPRRHVLTTTAGVLAGAGALPYLASSTQQIAGVSRQSQLAMARLGIPLDLGQNLARITGLVVLLLATWGLVLAAAILARRSWARLPGILTFATYGVVAVPLTLTGLRAGAPGAPVGLAAGLAALLAAYLLFRIEVNDDFDRASFAQQQRRTARAARGADPGPQ